MMLRKRTTLSKLLYLTVVLKSIYEQLFIKKFILLTF